MLYRVTGRDQPFPQADSEDEFSSSSESVAGDDSRDLLHLLPDLSLIDQCIDYYFSYCTWIYPHLHETAFKTGWTQYKEGHNPCHLLLATCCSILAISTSVVMSLLSGECAR
jgi:hypothetical protein